MKYGLLDRDFFYIKKGINNFPEIESVILFGSRAMGNFKKASDIDLAVKGKNVTRTTIIRLSGLLNDEYPIPFFFDIVYYDKIENIKLKEHIDIFGKVIYKKI
jgi:predicted nucleotidyltransferase